MRVEPQVFLNFIAFQVAWFACVLGGANDRALAGTMVVGTVIGLHLAIARRPLLEALLIALAAAIGLAWDSWLSAIFGAVGGPLAYLAGERFGSMAGGHGFRGWRRLLRVVGPVPDCAGRGRLVERRWPARDVPPAAQGVRRR